MSTGYSRYDGVADWYEATFNEFNGEEADFLAEALGAGHGQKCLDVACGTGRHGEAITGAGYVPVGIDISTDQLRFAKQRLHAVCADAQQFPFAGGVVGVVVGMYFHTDVVDFSAIVREVARGLRNGGTFIYVGLHPCFIGPFVDRTKESEDRALAFRGGYGRTGWARRGSGSGEGLWSRVGGHHKTMAEFIGAFAQAPFNIRSIREFSGGGSVLPRNLGIVAEKP